MVLHAARELQSLSCQRQSIVRWKKRSLRVSDIMYPPRERSIAAHSKKDLHSVSRPRKMFTRKYQVWICSRGINIFIADYFPQIKSHSPELRWARCQIQPPSHIPLPQLNLWCQRRQQHLPRGLPLILPTVAKVTTNRPSWLAITIASFQEKQSRTENFFPA